MAVTLPAFADNLAHPSWDQALTASVPMMMQGVVEFGKYAKPTTQLLWSNKQYIEVGPEKRFRLNWSYGGNDVHYGTSGTMTFNTEIKDTLSTMFASPEVLYAASSISDFGTFGSPLTGASGICGSSGSSEPGSLILSFILSPYILSKSSGSIP